MYNTVADRLRFAFLRKVVGMSTFAAVAGCSLTLFYLGDRYHLAIISGLGGMVFLVGLFVMLFTLPEVFARMEEKGTFLFSSAIAHTLYGYAMRLSFVPLIGPTLERIFFQKNETNPFVENKDGK